jgi:CBS domain containing-hemolysin-like protein
MIVTAFVIGILILINALYVAAEFSSVSVRRSRIRQRAEEGNALARRLLPYVDDPHRLDRYIAACQIGITVSSLILGAYGQARLAPALEPLFMRFGGMQQVAAESTAIVTVLIALTILQMVLGELVPKSIALQYPTGLALYTVLPMQWSLRFMSWFIALLNGSGLLVLRLIGVHQAGHRHIHSPEEIEYLIAESSEGGVFKADEHERLRRALRLGSTRVEGLMVPRTRMQAIAVSTPFEEAVKHARRSPFTRLPVYEETLDRIVGVLHVQDVVAHAVAGKSATVRALLRNVVVVPRQMSAEAVLTRLREERSHIAIVADEYGGTAGLISVGDILDEIFGGVPDEFKTAVPDAVKLPDGRVRLRGDADLGAATQWTGAEWEGDSVTVAGLIAERLGHVPEPGERLMIDGVALEVEAVAHHVVTSVLVSPITARAADGEDDDVVE